jgi:hypothetical protein
VTKRIAIYARVSTADQHPETQLLDLRLMAKQRGYEVVHQYTDIISGAKSRRPGLDQLLADARRHHFDIVLVAAFDRVARSVRHFLEVLNELNRLGIEFVSFRENIDTGGPLGRAMVVIIGAIAAPRDDDRLAPQLGIIPLLHGRIKCVHVDMYDFGQHARIILFLNSQGVGARFNSTWFPPNSQAPAGKSG